MKVIKSEQIMEGIFVLTIQDKRIANTSKPGQFVHIKIKNTLLRRPFSIYSVKNDNIEILYKVVGEGTKILSEYKTGETIDVLGPLGNGFSMYEYKEILLVAGGLGVAPIHFLAEKYSIPNTKITTFIGAKTKETVLCEKEFSEYGNVRVVTEDGSYGTKGMVTDLLNEVKPEIIFACGPTAMLKVIKEFARANFISCQISLEQRMGCGFGICLGCAVKVKNGYKYVCKDGPTFWADEIEIYVDKRYVKL